jgi:hypothetical protein
MEMITTNTIVSNTQNDELGHHQIDSIPLASIAVTISTDSLATKPTITAAMAMSVIDHQTNNHNTSSIVSVKGEKENSNDDESLLPPVPTLSSSPPSPSSTTFVLDHAQPPSSAASSHLLSNSTPPITQQLPDAPQHVHVTTVASSSSSPTASSSTNSKPPQPQEHQVHHRLPSSSQSASPRHNGIIGGQRPLSLSGGISYGNGNGSSKSSSRNNSNNGKDQCIINRLNGDALMHIFRFLDVSSLAQAASLVNRQWHRLSSHDSLWTELILLRWPELGPPPAAEPHPESVDPFETAETRRKSRAASLSSHLLADSQPSLLSLLLQHYIRIDRGSATGSMLHHLTNGTATTRSSSSMVRRNNNNRIIEEDSSCLCCCCCCGPNHHNGSGDNGIASATATPSRGSGNNVIKGHRSARWWYARWTTCQDIFGPSRIAYEYEFRPQPNMPTLDKGRHFIIEGNCFPLSFRNTIAILLTGLLC